MTELVADEGASGTMAHAITLDIEAAVKAFEDVPNEWKKGILKADTWAKEADEQFRIITANGMENKPGNNRYKKIGDLDGSSELPNLASLDLKGLYLVVPNEAAAKLLQSSSKAGKITLSTGSIQTLESDCGEQAEWPPRTQAWAYTLAVDGAKLVVRNDQTVLQAAFSITNNVTVMRAIDQLLKHNTKVKAIAATDDYGVIGHLGYMIGTKNTYDDVYNVIKSQGGGAWDGLDDLTAESIEDSQVEAVQKAYNVVEKASQSSPHKFVNEIKLDKEKVKAVMPSVGAKEDEVSHKKRKQS